jgi:hypothetical protein
MRLRLIWIAIECQCLMVISHLRKTLVSTPPISANDAARRNIFFSEVHKHFRASIWNDAKPQSSGIDATPRASAAIILTRPNFHGTDYGSLVMRTAPFPARLTADVTFVYLYGMIASDSITLGAHHARAEFVKNLKCCLISAKRELALKLNSRLARCLRGHEVRAPKPCRERRMARLHDSASHKRCVRLAPTAAQHYRRARLESVWCFDEPAFRARKTIGPANSFKITGTSRVIGEYPLKFWKGSGEAAYVHGQKYSNPGRGCQATG